MDLARQADPDVIMLDIVMPDGFEVCRRLKSEKALRHIPVVFLTALKTGREGRIQALDAGGDGFLWPSLWDEAELLGTLVQNRYQAPDEREKIFSEMLAKGCINDFQIAFTDKNSGVMPSAITAMVMAGADGQPVKVCGVLRDISQRKAV